LVQYDDDIQVSDGNEAMMYGMGIDDQYIDDGQYIDLPWLASGEFNWSRLIDPYSRRRGENRIPVAHDYLPLQKTLTDADGIRRCDFLGKTSSEENISRCLQEMQNFKDNIRKTIKTILFKYWIYNCNKLGLRLGHEANRKIRSVTDVLLILRTPQNLSEIKKVRHKNVMIIKKIHFISLTIFYYFIGFLLLDGLE
jgi:hypothetical protein